MNNTEKGTISKSFSYPGTFGDYSRQALQASGIFGAALIAVFFAVLAFDRIIYGQTRLTWWHVTGLLLVFTGVSIIAQLMARSLSLFRITADDRGLTIRRSGAEVFVSFGEISGVDRLRVPGWWPLKADLKSRGKTARRLIRIKRKQGPPLTFISGLEGEEDLIGRIVSRAATEEKK